MIIRYGLKLKVKLTTWMWGKFVGIWFKIKSPRIWNKL